MARLSVELLAQPSPELLARPSPDLAWLSHDLTFRRSKTYCRGRRPSCWHGREVENHAEWRNFDLTDRSAMVRTEARWAGSKRVMNYGFAGVYVFCVCVGRYTKATLYHYYLSGQGRAPGDPTACVCCIRIGPGPNYATPRYLLRYLHHFLLRTPPPQCTWLVCLGEVRARPAYSGSPVRLGGSCGRYQGGVTCDTRWTGIRAWLGG